jgi:hypothetical protein
MKKRLVDTPGKVLHRGRDIPITLAKRLDLEALVPASAVIIQCSTAVPAMGEYCFALSRWLGPPGSINTVALVTRMLLAA